MLILRTTRIAVVCTLQARDSWPRQCTVGTQSLVPSGWLRSDKTPENEQLIRQRWSYKWKSWQWILNLLSTNNSETVCIKYKQQYLYCAGDEKCGLCFLVEWVMSVVYLQFTFFNTCFPFVWNFLVCNCTAQGYFSRVVWKSTGSSGSVNDMQSCIIL